MQSSGELCSVTSPTDWPYSHMTDQRMILILVMLSACYKYSSQTKAALWHTLHKDYIYIYRIYSHWNQTTSIVFKLLPLPALYTRIEEINIASLRWKHRWQNLKWIRDFTVPTFTRPSFNILVKVTARINGLHNNDYAAQAWWWNPKNKTSLIINFTLSWDYRLIHSYVFKSC